MRTAKLLPLKSDITIEEAEDARRTENPSSFEQGVLTEEEFMGIRMPEKKFILQDLITEESISIINGFRGSGKSWLILNIANEVTWKGNVGPWKVKNAVNTMVIDGEMPLNMIQERMKMMNKGRNINSKEAELYIYPEAYAYRIGLKRANILDSAWRSRVYDAVLNRDVKLLILDNLSSLAPGIDENEKMSFDPVNRWLLELRFHGVATIMTHHTGKSGEQRGTTAHEDHVDISLLLGKPGGYKHDDGCKFVCKPIKDRALVTGGKERLLKLTEDENKRIVFMEEERDTTGRVARIIEVDPSMSLDNAVKMGISRATYFRARRVAMGLPPR
jgi:hypothetical protein